jgi:hypothetical protein
MRSLTFIAVLLFCLSLDAISHEQTARRRGQFRRGNPGDSFSHTHSGERGSAKEWIPRANSLYCGFARDR